MIAANISLADQPAGALLVVYALMLGLGLVLWYFGGRMVRPLFATSGLTFGALIAYGLLQAMEIVDYRLIWIGVGAVAGYLLALMLFRFWMGLSMGLLLAAVVPVACIIWQGDTIETPVFKHETHSQSSSLAPSQLNSEQVQEQVEETLDKLIELNAQQRTHVEQWWNNLSDKQRKVFYSTSGIGFLVGLAIGLIFPRWTSLVQASFAGAILITVAVEGLALTLLSEQPSWLPLDPKVTLVIVGLITVTGLALQWTISRRRDDK